LALDFGVILMGWGLFLFLTARPLVSAVVIIGLAIGLIVVDQVKRAVLKEPVVFADRAELWEVVRHPQLYLPFAGTGRVLGGAAVIVIGFVTLLFLEPALWPLSPLPPLFGIIVVLALMLLPGRQALLPHLARVYTNWAPSRDPTSDAKRFGLLASFVIHATLARAERQQRRAGLAPARQTHPAAAGTIVLVQSESFFDAARLDPALADRVLPEFSALRSTASLTGRLDVPCWGANTIRTEFAVLTGVEGSRLGLDRFNPYEAFARTPIESLAWRARAAGWRTICVHPFDLRFYGRNHVLPMLGFETLIGQEAFKGADHYVADIDLAQRVVTELDEVSGGVLILVITMEGHGPWGAGDPADTIALPPALAEVPEHVALSRYLFRQKSADRAIPILTEAVRRRLGRGVLALYGDHQPSLPKAFAAIGLADTRTDYVIWRSDIPGNGEWQDMPAHLLGQAIGEAVGLT
jgi:phosphoglycerol transferase MdoB-like AlkP superfamily enzyme